MSASKQADDVPAKAAPPKRSLFNKPSWSKPVAAHAPADLFQRSSTRYTEVVQEQEKRRARKAARLGRERQRPSGDDEERGGKRRRISERHSDDDDDDSSSGSDDGSGQDKLGRPNQQTSDLTSDTGDKLPTPSSAVPDSAVESCRQSSDASPAVTRPSPTQAAPILLSDDDDVVDTQPKRVQDADSIIVADAIPDDEESIASDEEFPDLVRKARERAKLRKLEASAESSTPKDGKGSKPSQTGKPPTPELKSQQSPQAPAEPDTKVSVLITSRIPNTSPLLVQIRLQQRLKDVRLAWCLKQSLDAETTESVFLTWKGIKLHDVTTCKSLGLGVDRDGILVRHGRRQSLTEEERQVHMEIWTAESWTEHREAKNKRDDADEKDDPNTEWREGGAVASQGAGDQVRIVLKSRGYPDYKLIVKPTTTAERMVTAFREARGVPAEKEVFLVFDGDRMQPGDSVADTDIGDMDNLDVHVK